MAVAGLYTIGYSFWNSVRPTGITRSISCSGVSPRITRPNPIKIGLDKLKRRGAKFVSINPVRTGYSAIADEWIPIGRARTGFFALALVHVLVKRGLVDWEF